MQDRYQPRNITLYNGVRISYLDEGSGPVTLLMIHGLANYAKSWQQNIAALKADYRCIAVDLPGNGLSDEAREPYTLSYFARCLIDFIGRLGLQRLCLVGHSMGGQIALKMLLEAPFCAERLVLCAPAGFEVFHEMDKLLYQGSMHYVSWISNDEHNLRQTIRSSFYHFPKGAEDMIRELTDLMHHRQARHYRAMVDQCIQAMLNEPVYGSLHLILQPALILFGDRDALIPNRMLHPVSTRQVAEQGVARMPAATLRMITQCGHFLQWEKAAEVNGSIRTWLQETEGMQ